MPKVFIDDTEVEAPDGFNMIQAAKIAGIEIPHFCYHPGLGVDGNCRLCLVEIDGVAKPQVACNTFVKEGLRIRTDTERIKELRRAVLEFFFLHHPLDCPICDQSGECLLQDFYMTVGQYVSRLDLPKHHKRKVVDVGPRIILDAERCVLCRRCVRFCDQITGTGELRIINRGHRSEIAIFPDRPLANPYSLNVVDLCPVGALTSKDFRFKCRVWYLEATKSVCTGCARGCNTYLEHNEGTIYRCRPRENARVNQWWMCDDGRMTYKSLNDNRCVVPSIDEQRAGHREAIDAIAAKVKTAQERGGDGAIALFVSPEMSNESLYAAQAFATKVLGTRRIIAGSLRAPGVEDSLLRRADLFPNRKGCELLSIWRDDLRTELRKGGRVALLIQSDVVDDDPGAAADLERFETVICLATNLTRTTAKAAIIHPVTPHSECEGTFTNFQGRVQRFRRAMPPKGEALTVMELLARIAERLGVTFGWVSMKQIWGEMTRSVSALEGIDPLALGDDGMTVRSLRRDAGAGVEGD